MSWTPERHQQHGEQQQRPVGDGLAADPLDQQHQARDRAEPEEHRAHQAEEAERLLGELGEEEERRDVEQAPEIDSRAVDPRACVARMLRHRHFVDPVPFAQRERGDEPVQVAVQRQRFGRRSGA